MGYQIILLPRKDYWGWVRACKEYVLTFGVNLTADPATAAGYMAPRQVVTVPRVRDGYPEQGDIVTWFQSHHEGIRLDAIDASTPEELGQELGLRVRDHDRFGQSRKPFAMVWPTDYPVVTQRFGANPRIYNRWGLPGHEGLDIRALTNTNVYACADGTVYEVHTNARDHPYGIHVRIRHRDGYKTIYAHLARAVVQVGEVVQASQLIGKADSTGNSSAAHLHLGLKRDGATQRGETNYPKDIIDPTPFMVWPEGVSYKSLPQAVWPAGKCLVGAWGRIGAPLRQSDLDLIGEARLEAVLLSQSESRETIERLRAANPAMFIMVRLTADFSDRPVTAAEFVASSTANLGRLFRIGVHYFEVHTSPNLQTEGFQRSWRGGREFAGWFEEVVDRLRSDYPEAKYGFPGLSPGSSVAGQRGDSWEFLHEGDEAIQAADWVGVSCYWTDAAGMNALDGGRVYEEYRMRYPDRLLFITEFGNAAAGTSARLKGEQYLAFYRTLRETPAIGAAFAYALSSEAGYAALTWAGDGQEGSEIAGLVGGRGF
jgi:murein DD-endopeptidase MepM/ murein hydrolase activator NlpD